MNSDESKSVQGKKTVLGRVKVSGGGKNEITEIRESKTRNTFSGSTIEQFSDTLQQQLMNSLWTKFSDKETLIAQAAAAFASMMAIKPADEVEGMLGVQMVATHNAAMECFRRAMIPDQTLEGRQAALKHANSLTRSYALLLDTLNRHRGKGVTKQRVTVKHVHVNAGGQAVIGAVATGNGGRDGKHNHA